MQGECSHMTGIKLRFKLLSLLKSVQLTKVYMWTCEAMVRTHFEQLQEKNMLWTKFVFGCLYKVGIFISDYSIFSCPIFTSFLPQPKLPYLPGTFWQYYNHHIVTCTIHLVQHFPPSNCHRSFVRMQRKWEKYNSLTFRPLLRFDWSRHG